MELYTDSHLPIPNILFFHTSFILRRTTFTQPFFPPSSPRNAPILF